MIQLTVISLEGKGKLVTSAPYFRIIGGAIWVGPGTGADTPLAHFISGQWKHAEALWSGMRFEGKCRLVFGIPRDPARVSGEIDGLSVHGDTVSMNGIPFAVFDPAREMWRGAGAHTWWHAFRVESSGFRPAMQVPDGSEQLMPRATSDRNETAPRFD